MLCAAVTEAGMEDCVNEAPLDPEGEMVNTLEPLVVRSPEFVEDEELPADAVDMIAGTRLVGYVVYVPFREKEDAAVLDADVT